MEADERQRQILARARNDGRVEVSSLADDLHVAPETVRRDLRQLVERGMLQRVHGGAHPVEGVGYESDLTHRTSSMIGCCSAARSCTDEPRATDAARARKAEATETSVSRGSRARATRERTSGRGRPSLSIGTW